MSNTRTNQLHKRLPLELRGQIESDLVSQPPGRSTYRQVFEHYGLAELGISIKAVERFGLYLRQLRDSRIHEVQVEFNQSRRCLVVSGFRVRIPYDQLIEELRRQGELKSEGSTTQTGH